MFALLGFLELFNSREIAVFIWLVLAAVAVMFFPGVPAALAGVARSLLAPKLLLPFILAFGYWLVAIYLANRLGLWHGETVKEATYWFFTVGVVLVGTALGNPAKGVAFRSLVRRTLEFTVLIEFLVGVYVLPFPLEIVLIPVVTMLVLTSSVAGTDKKFASVGRLVDGLIAISGLALLAFALLSALTDIGSLLTVENGESLLVAPVLTIAFIPFVYGFALLSAYEQLFLRVHFSLRPDGQLERSAKWTLVRCCRMSVRRVTAFSGHWVNELGTSASDAEVKAVVRRFRQSNDLLSAAGSQPVAAP